MSRGFGRVQRELGTVFEHIGNRTYSIEELCEQVYATRYPEKRHRVAVLRAVDSVLKRYPWIGKFGGGPRYSYFFCDCRDVHAYAILQQRRYFGQSHRLAEERLAYELANPGPYNKAGEYMEPQTGRWWLYCEAIKAQSEGNATRGETLMAKYQEAEKKDQAQRAAIMRMLR